MGTDGGVSRRQVEKLADLPRSERRDRLGELGELLSGGPPYVRSRAVELVADVSEEYPGAIAEVVDPVAGSLGTAGLSTDAARAIANLAAEEPAVVRDHLPLLIAAIDGSESVTVQITRALAAVSETSPAALAQPGICETLVGLLDDDNVAVRTNASAVLGAVAGTDPSAVADAGDKLRDRLGDPSPAVQRNAAFAIGRLGGYSPGTLFRAIPGLCGLLESDDPGVRSGATYALSEAATTADAADDRAIESLLEQLRVDDSSARQHAAFVLAELAAADPEMVGPHAGQLARGLADCNQQVRRNLLQALGILEEKRPEAVEEAYRAVSGALRTVDPGDVSGELTPSQLRGLAGERRAPHELRQAAREALVGHNGETGGGDSDTGDSDGGAVGASDQAQPDETGRTCPNCGEQFGSDATFCSVCGTSLE